MLMLQVMSVVTLCLMASLSGIFGLLVDIAGALAIVSQCLLVCFGPSEIRSIRGLRWIVLVGPLPWIVLLWNLTSESEHYVPLKWKWLSALLMLLSGGLSLVFLRCIPGLLFSKVRRSEISP